MVFRRDPSLPSLRDSPQHPPIALYRGLPQCRTPFWLLDPPGSSARTSPRRSSDAATRYVRLPEPARTQRSSRGSARPSPAAISRSPSRSSRLWKGWTRSYLRAKVGDWGHVDGFRRERRGFRAVGRCAWQPLHQFVNRHSALRPRPPLAPTRPSRAGEASTLHPIGSGGAARAAISPQARRAGCDPAWGSSIPRDRVLPRLATGSTKAASSISRGKYSQHDIRRQRLDAVLLAIDSPTPSAKFSTSPTEV